jgi:hypothetical protein
MKLSTALVLLASTGTTNAFVVPSTTSITSTSSSALCAEIRPPTPKNEVLEFGWDGTTALGGAVDDSKPARMLDEIRASGEMQNSACDLFNANLEMSGDDLTFEEFITHCDENYEDGLIEFKNGDIVNKPNENHGSAKVLSYAALADFDQETTLKLWGQYYRDVKANPEGDDHQNIRNFMKYGWEGVDFYNGVALTKKVGEDGWDWDAESFIP